MVDFSTRSNSNKKLQRAFHMDDATHDRLRQAAALSSSTMSQVLDRLIWEDLRLPGDAPADKSAPAVVGTAQAHAAISALPQAAKPARDPGAVTEAGRVPTEAEQARIRERLKRSGHYATEIDGSDQRERDPDNHGRGGGGEFESPDFGGARPSRDDFNI